MRTLPSASIVPRSPVWNHPPASIASSSSVSVDVADEALRALQLELTLLPGAAHSCRAGSTARTETPEAGRPTDVETISKASVGAADVAFGNSVRPQLPTRGTSNTARISSWISAGTGAPPKHPNRKEGKRGWSPAARASVQIGPEERDGSAQHGGVVASHPDRRRRGVEGIEEDEVDPTPQACGQDRGAADVGDRPRDRIEVPLAQSHQLEHGVGRGHDAGVGVAGALGIGGGARRVVDPTGPVEWRGRRERGRISRGQPEILR